MLQLEFRTDFDHFQRWPIAPIELVEYGDFQCSLCSEVYLVIKQLQDHFGKLLKLVYRHYPMPNRHPLSLRVAAAAEAAASQGKFWQMHDMIYEKQQSLTCNSFVEFARDIDLDVRAFADCREHRKSFRKVINDFESGVKSGVDNTPTFFINGILYNGFYDFQNLFSALQNIDYSSLKIKENVNNK